MFKNLLKEKLRDFPGISFIHIGKSPNDKGTYLFLLKNIYSKEFIIGKLGNFYFKNGYYIYIGSGYTSLSKRVLRHLKRNKTIKWHIDHITSNRGFTPLKYQILFHDMKIEDELAESIISLGDNVIKGFGASDSKVISHLVYFKKDPLKNQDFLNLIDSYSVQRPFN